ncbi:MAG: thiamine phosphate synthase [Spirochaetaceae bacterium]|nr:thiamine phosphate synthase [Spirochaetaceae bacterium]
MVTVRPDAERLVHAVDAQMKAIDRYVNDFLYLNEQSSGSQNVPDSKMIVRIAEMLEALYDCDDGAREAVEAATAGGVTLVQLREKEAETREFYEIAREVAVITRRRRVPLVVNDRIDIALAIGADGLHLGQTDMPLAEARRLVGKSMFIGISTSTVEEALAAEHGGADYLGVGAVFPTGSKADAGEAIGPGRVAEIRAAVGLPIVAIGGIGPANAAGVMSRGADGVAVISAILSQPDIRAAAAALRAALGA